MSGTTHQMVALLAAFWVLVWYPVSVGPYTGTIAVIAVMVGALTPDLDQPTANIWRRLLGSRALGSIFQRFSGGHRHLTHSIVGIIGLGFLSHWLLTNLLNPHILPAAEVVWIAYMIGYISHPMADTLTDQGVPWLWPLPWQIKIPPGSKAVRVTTDSIVEVVLVRGLMLLLAAFLLQRYWVVLQEFFR